MKASKISIKKMIVFFIISTSFCLSADNTSPQRSVYIIEPLDGAEVGTKVTVKFGLVGMGVAPAGVDIANTGHHHLLIDATILPAKGEPMTNTVTHFGGGQTETELTLSKGTHTLQLIMGDKAHIPIEPFLISPKITIKVK